MTATSLISRIASAATCEELFGASMDEHALSMVFKDMAMLLHPDRAKGPKAASAMARLTELRGIAKAKLKAGTYGKPDVKPVVIKASKTYEDVLPLAKGDFCDVYSATVADSKAATKPRVAIKLARDFRDADLMDREAEVLKYLWSGDRSGGDVFGKVLPKLIESTRLTIDGKVRRANILSIHDKRITVTRLLQLFPNGLHAADMAWLWRRILEVIAWSHREGVVHGAVLPDHILVDVEHHTIKLIDWKAACWLERKEAVRIVSNGADIFYPDEVFKKKPATPATDLYMSAVIAKMLTNKQCPPAITKLLDFCTLLDQKARFQDAWEVHEEFTKILRRLYGPPKFRKLTLPEE